VTRSVWKPVAVAAAAALGVALLGGQMTDIGPWYQGLRQPSWKPPDVWFGPAWTTIFALAAAAGVLAWRASPDRPARERLLVAFAANASLNVFWSLLFFRLRRPDWALAEVGFLWFSIAVLVAMCWRRSRLAGALLLPYLAWVTFATSVNAGVVRLNGPFG
jgi:benzodiazapine receptor